MNLEQSLENRLIEIARKAQELEFQNASLDEETGTMLAENNVTPEQLTTFISSPDNFTEDNWNTLQEEKKKREEKLARDLANVVDPAKKKKALKSLHLPSYALFVR